MMNKLTPSYYLFIEKKNGGSINILYAKKQALKKQSYYTIQLESDKKSLGINENNNNLGKLRAMDGDKNKFVLYDNGSNFQKKDNEDDYRQEHGTFIYRYEPCNVGNIRKMIIIFPSIIETPASERKEPMGLDLFKLIKCKPTNVKETLLS